MSAAATAADDGGDGDWRDQVPEDLRFTTLSYPLDEVEIIDEQDPFRRSLVAPATADNLERYSCPLEVLDGDNQTDPSMLHMWFVNSALSYDPTLLPIVSSYEKRSLIPAVSMTGGRDALEINIPSVRRSTASRHYLVNRKDKDTLEPIAVITVIPRMFTETHYVASGKPMYINAPFLYAALITRPPLGSVLRSASQEVFRWVQYRRPNPEAMRAGLDLLNASLRRLLQLAAEKGSLIRALGEPEPVMNGDLGEIITAILLGAKFSAQDENKFMLSGQPYNDNAPLPIAYRFDDFVDWPSVRQRIRNAIVPGNRAEQSAVNALSNDLYIAVLTRYTAGAAVRNIGIKERAGAFSVVRASSSTAGIYHCSVLNKDSKEADSLRAKLASSVLGRYIAVYDRVAAFEIHVVGEASGSDSIRASTTAVTRAEYITLDPSLNYSATLDVTALVLNDAYSFSSRDSRVAWHAIKPPRRVDVTRPDNIELLDAEVLFPLTKIACTDGELVATGLPFTQLASTRVPLRLVSDDLINYSLAQNGGNPNRPVQLILLAYLQEPTDKIGLNSSSRVSYADVAPLRGGFEEAASTDYKADLLRFDQNIGIHSDPFVARPLVGLAIVNVEIVANRQTQEGAAGAVATSKAFSPAFAAELRLARTAINLNKDYFERIIRGVILYRIDCASYVANVILGQEGVSQATVGRIGEIYDTTLRGRRESELEPSAANPNFVVWSVSKLQPPFPLTYENLTWLEDISPGASEVARRANTISWLERITTDYKLSPTDGRIVSTEYARMRAYQEDRNNLISDFLTDDRNAVACVAMVAERDRRDRIKRNKERFEDVAVMFVEFKNFATALVFQDLNGLSIDEILEILERSPQVKDNGLESDEEYLYRQEVVRTVRANVAALDALRERYNILDRSTGTMPIQAVKEIMQNMLSNPTRFPGLSSRDRDLLEDAMSVALPGPHILIRQINAPTLGQELLEELTSEAAAADLQLSFVGVAPQAAAAAATGKPSRLVPRRRVPGVATPAPSVPVPVVYTAGPPPLASALLKPQAIQGESNILRNVDRDVYDEVVKLQPTIDAFTERTRKSVEDSLAIERQVIGLLESNTGPSNAVVRHLKDQISIFTDDSMQSFQELIRKTYAIETDGQPSLAVTQPVFVAVRGYMALKSSGANPNVAAIATQAGNLIKTKGDNLKNLYGITITLRSDNLVLQNLKNIIEDIVMSPVNSRFDSIFANDAGYQDFKRDTRDVIPVFMSDERAAKSRLSTTVDKLIQYLDQLEGVQGPQAQKIRASVTALLERITGRTGLLNQVSEVSQEFVRSVDRDIVNRARDYVLSTNIGKDKKPSDLVAQIKDGLVGTNRSNLKTLVARLAQLSKEAIQVSEPQTIALGSEVAAISAASLSSSTTSSISLASFGGGAAAKPTLKSSPLTTAESHYYFYSNTLGLANTKEIEESRARAIATRGEPISVQQFIRDLWLSPAMVSLIEQDFKANISSPTATPGAAPSIRELVIMGEATRAASSESARVSDSPLYLRLIGRVSDMIDDFANEAGWLYGKDLEARKAAARTSFVNDTTAYFEAARVIIRDAVRAEIAAVLGRRQSLSQPAPMPSVLMDEIKQFAGLKASVTKTAETLWNEYLDALRISYNRFMNNTFLWQTATSKNRGFAPTNISRLMPGLASLEGILGWNTGSLDAQARLVSDVMPDTDIRKSVLRKRIDAITREQGDGSTLPLKKLVEMSIKGGFVNSERYLSNFPRPDIASQCSSSLRGVFALYCRGMVHMILTAVDRVLDTEAFVEFVKPLSSDPKRQARFVASLLSSWVEGTQPSIADLINAAPQTDANVYSTIASDLGTEFTSVIASFLDTMEKSKEFIAEITRAGAKLLTNNDTFKMEQLLAFMRTAARTFCIEHLFRGVSVDLQPQGEKLGFTKTMSADFYQASLELIGAPALDRTAADYSLIAEDTELVRDIGFITSGASRYALVEQGVWTTVTKRPAAATGLPASTSVLPINTTVGAVVCAFIEEFAGLYYPRFGYNPSAEAIRILTNGLRKLRKAVGYVQARVDDIKEEEILSKGDQVSEAVRDYTIEAAQKFADKTALNARGLFENNNDVISRPADALARTKLWEVNIKELEDQSRQSLATLRNLIRDHVQKSSPSTLGSSSSASPQVSASPKQPASAKGKPAAAKPAPQAPVAVPKGAAAAGRRAPR